MEFKMNLNYKSIQEKVKIVYNVSSQKKLKLKTVPKYDKFVLKLNGYMTIQIQTTQIRQFKFLKNI